LIAVVKYTIALEKDEFAIKLGERIRKLREKKGISVRDFETYDNSMDRHALSKIENGHTIPSAFTLYRISKVIGVSVSEFFKEIE
jgi:transcriptional regulator with XRE-family HTH domain